MAQSLIINSPYKVPCQHWQQARDGSLTQVPQRRPAGYEIFDVRSNTKRTEPLELVNAIRVRVDEWRAADYPGITSVTRRLLEHWRDNSARQFPFYFCQVEAIETLIWWLEGKQGISVPGDGGDWTRLCNKMATGSGKTALMAMIITWQVLNALTYPKRNRIAPSGLRSSLGSKVSTPRGASAPGRGMLPFSRRSCRTCWRSTRRRRIE